MRPLRLLGLLWLAGCAAAGKQPADPPSTAAALTALSHGILAFNHGEDEEAAALLQEAVQLDPRDGTARHWLGLVDLQLGRTREAVEQLQASLQAEHPPAAGRERVLADLRAAREALERGQPPPAFVEPPFGPVALSFEELPRWDLQIGLESAYDSNAALISESLPFAVPGIVDVGEEVPADLVAGLTLRAAANPFYDHRGWSLGLSLDGSHFQHQDLGTLDLTGARGIASLVWGRSPSGIAAGPLGYTRVPSGTSRVRVLLQAGGSATWLDGSSYLNTAEGALSVAFPESSWGETRIELRARDRDFPDDDDLLPDRRLSGSDVAAGLGQLFPLGGGGRSLRLDVVAGQIRAGRVFDSSFGEASAEISAPLATRWSLTLLGGLRQDRFDNPESNLGQPAGPEREDDTWRIAAVLLWRIDERLTWTLRGSHADRESNVRFVGSPLLDYGRDVVSVGLLWRP